MKHLKIIGALAAIGLGIIVAMTGQPSLDEQVKAKAAELDETLKSRKIFVDPAELLDAIYNDNMAVKILDVRSETDFNLFHIKNAELVTMDMVRDAAWVKTLPKKAVIMLVSNDEAGAVEAWKLLQVQKAPNLYILEGGINNWLARYGDLKPKPGLAAHSDRVGYLFEVALGGNHPASDPNPEVCPKRQYVKRIESVGKTAKKAGGCG